MSDETSPPEPALARRALADLRPQDFGNGPLSKVLDPIVEPLWTGLRALAAIGWGDVELVDVDGDPLGGLDSIVEALAAAVPSGEVVVDGFITKQATHTASPVVAWSGEMPTMGSMIGLRRNRAMDTVKLKETSLAANTFEETDDLAFVVTDLLWLDDTPLLDIPLLERRRLLEAVVVESDGVRLGAFVRPPIERWVASWRSQGFGGLTYKAANSRYLPGMPVITHSGFGLPGR